MAESAEALIQTLLSGNLCTPEQVDEGKDIQRKMKEMGITPKPLAEILLDKGYITRDQYNQVSSKPIADRGSLEKDSIPGYELLKKIGQGGMGAVFQARQVSMDRIVALKVLPPKLAKDGQFRERFLREARAVARLNHENIIQGIDVGVAGGLYYFVMEFVDGRPVSKELTEKGTLPEKESLSIAMQICKALDHANRHKFVHRDVKPENIMVTKDGVAKLCDLGLAKQDQGDTGLTQAGLAVGTPNYISPEQARGEADADTRSDIYALGASLYHMLTGKVPFEGNVPSVVMTKHITEDLVPPNKHRADLTPETNAIIVKAMQKRREDRYQEPAQMGQDIEAAMTGRPLTYAKIAGAKKAPVAAAAAAGAPPNESGHKPRLGAVHQKLTPARKSSPAVPIAIASVVAIGILAGAIAMSRKKDTKEQPAGPGVGSTGTVEKPPVIGDNSKPPVIPVSADAEKEKKIEAEFKVLTGYIDANGADPARFRDIEDRFAEFIATYRKTAWENRAIVEQKKFRDGLDASAKALLAKINTEIEAVRREGRFYEALSIVESRWMRHLEGTPTQAAYVELMDALKGDIAAAWTRDKGAATALKDKKEFEKAIASLDAVKKYASPQVQTDADKLREEIRKAGEDYLVQLSETGRRRYDAEFWPPLEKALFERRYKDGLTHCGKFMNDAEMASVRDRISAMIDDVTSLNIIFSDAARGADVAITTKEKVTIKKTEVSIASREGDRVNYNLSGGSTSILIPKAAEEDIAVLCQVAFNALAADKKAAEKGAFAFRMGLLFYYTTDEKDKKRAVEEFDKAAKEGVERAKWYLARLGEKGMGETELAAKKLYEDAFDAFNAKRLPDAKTKFQRLLSEFGATSWVKDHRDTITKRLAECDGKVAGDSPSIQSLLKGQVVRTYAKGAVEIHYDFSKADQLTDFTVGDGTWTWDKDGQALAGTAPDTAQRGLSWNVPMTGDLSVELEITPGGDKNIAISVCSDLAGKHYMALLGGVLTPQILTTLGNPDFKQVALVKWGGRPPFAILGTAADPRPVKGEKMKVRVSRAGKSLSVYVGGKKVCEGTDENYKSGQISLFLIGSDAKFDEITIYGTPDDAWLKSKLGSK